MIEIIPAESIDAIGQQREQYIQELAHPQELNTEENVWKCLYHKIMIDSVWKGYFCVDSQKTMWEFYLEKDAVYNSRQIFQHLIDLDYIVAAECKSYDDLFLSLCFDFNKRAVCSAYVFVDHIDAAYSPSGYENISIERAIQEDLPRLSALFGEFFYNLSEEIRKEEVLLFHLNGELAGAGTCKKDMAQQE